MHGHAAVKNLCGVQSTAAELADLLTSGFTGMRLLAELSRVFSNAIRSDVFFGVAIAISLFEADRISLLHELLVAEDKLVAGNTEHADGR